MVNKPLIAQFMFFVFCVSSFFFVSFLDMNDMVVRVWWYDFCVDVLILMIWMIWWSDDMTFNSKKIGCWLFCYPACFCWWFFTPASIYGFCLTLVTAAIVYKRFQLSCLGAKITTDLWSDCLSLGIRHHIFGVWFEEVLYPIGSMYGIFSTPFLLECGHDVGKRSIHGASGYKQHIQTHESFRFHLLAVNKTYCE